VSENISSFKKCMSYTSLLASSLLFHMYVITIFSTNSRYNLGPIFPLSHNVRDTSFTPSMTGYHTFCQLSLFVTLSSPDCHSSPLIWPKFLPVLTDSLSPLDFSYEVIIVIG
jgi:hypothetical protein